jgi:hypothetical protein
MVYWMNFKLMRLIERLNLSWHINVIVKYEVISTLTEQNIRNWGSNFGGFRGSLKPRKSKSNEIQFKNPWINVSCRNHENWCQRINLLSQYICNCFT